MVVEIHQSVDKAAEVEAARLQVSKWELIEMALRDFLKLHTRGAA